MTIFEDFAERDLWGAYDKAPFSWEARPIDETGKKVEDGDQVLLACRQYQLEHIDITGTFGSGTDTDGFIGWAGPAHNAHAKWYPVQDEQSWNRKKALVFTIKRTEDDHIALEACINGKICMLNDNKERPSFADWEDEKAYQTAWDPTESGYILRFETQRVRTVVANKDGEINTSGDSGRRGFRIALKKYPPPPTTFGWDHRPKATDGTQLNDGDQFTMMVSVKGRNKDDQEWNLIRDSFSTGVHLKMDFDKSGSPLVWTARHHAPSDSLHFTTDDQYSGKRLIMAATSNKEARKKIILEEAPKPIEHARIGCEPTTGGYHLYFQTEQYTPVYGESNLFAGKDKYPRVFRFFRVSK